jgi:hypothetical protein
MEDWELAAPHRLEQPGRVHGRALDQLGAAEPEGRVGERVLEVDDEHGRSLARLDARLTVAAPDPRIVGSELQRHC